MKRTILFIVLIFILVPVLKGQNDYIETLDRIVARSLSLKAAREAYTADSLGFRRGLNPNDPTVSIDYFINSGVSFESRIEQSFDFPTVYRQRNQISKLNIGRGADELYARKRELLIEASDLYISMIYQARLIEVLEKRSENLDKIADLNATAVEKGEQTVLELFQTRSMASEVRSLLVLARSEYAQAATRIAQMNGGEAVTIKAGDYPSFVFNGGCEEFVRAAVAGDYTLKAAITDSLIAERTLKLSRNEWLPKLVAGFRLDIDRRDPLYAVAAGISIPLWQNRGNVKHAKAQIRAAQSSKAETESRLRVNLSNLHNQYSAAREALQAYGEVDKNYPELLARSFEAGNINQIEFLHSAAAWFIAEGVRMDLEYRLAHAAATMSIYLAD